VIAATLSSAMASFLGAPRILQSLSGDRIFSFLNPFSKGAGPNSNPRRGVLLSAGIAFTTIALGNLNVIAPVVSMFFLISYGLLNYATFFEARSASPSFRPRFRWYNRRLSLMGFLACLGVMLAIDIKAGIIAVAVLFAIYQYLRRTAGPARWADSRRSYHLQMVREHLIAAENETEHPRDWRPQILAMTGDPSRRTRLLQFARWIQGGAGMTTAVQVIEGEGLKVLRERQEAEEALRKDIKENKLPAFPLVVSTRNFADGGYTMIQSFGIGPVKANIILLNWLQDCSKGVPGIREFSLGKNLRMAFRLGCSIVVLDASSEEWDQLQSTPLEERRIDIWWLDDASSNLMLLFGHLMTRSEAWRDAKIRVLAPGHENTEENLKSALDEARINAEPIIVKEGPLEVMLGHSADATIVLLPFRLTGNQIAGPFGFKIEDVCPRLPVSALVLAAKDVDLDAEPEEGTAGEIAQAMDTLEDAQEKVKEAEKEVKKALDAVEKAERRVDELIASAGPGADREAMKRIEKEIREAKEVQNLAEKALRRAAKTKARAEEAARAAEEKGVKVDRGKDADEKDSQEEEKESKK
ncbi:amino acid permease, partial [Thermodesulfobacteriota bacterium]